MDIIRDIFQYVPLPFVVAWWVIAAITAYLFITGIRKHFQAWRRGRPEEISGSRASRIGRLISTGLAQSKILNKKYNGLIHALVSIIGFLLLLGMFFPILEGVVG